MRIVDKVCAYITHGDDLLVFEQPDFPEAGIQVPGGSVEAHERPADAVMRGAYEETGLPGLSLVRFLGMRDVPAENGVIHRRHFFHLVAADRRIDTWDHLEERPASGGPPIRFRLRWAPRAPSPPLVAGLDALLGQLSLGLERPITQLPPPGTTIRFASRVLLLDHSDRLLLLSATAFDGRPFWVAPGGGLAAGEHYCDALVREITEEVGVDVELGPIVWLRRHVLPTPSGTFDQTERFFVARTPCPDLNPTQQDDYIHGHRWWTLSELLSSSDTMAPRGLREHIPNIVAGSFPEEPFDVGV